MRDHASKLEHANVVAGFDSQDDADEAVLGLRISGIPDHRIGYYYPTRNGQMEDLLANRHRFAAAVLGSIIGLVLGAAVGWFLDQRGTPGMSHIDPWGLAATLGIIGSLCLGTVGGMTGLWTARPGAFAPAPPNAAEPFVIAVDAGDAGDAREQVWAILHQHGGHELRPIESAPHYAPGGNPA